MDHTTDSIRLRQNAEKSLKKEPLAGSFHSEADIQKLIHELEVHQIELEMQNEELRLAKERELELASEKYIELYDFAPSGYYTLSRNGEIIDLNLAGAKMLGKVRSSLKNNKFAFFVTYDTRPIFDHFLEKAFSSKSKEACELTISGDENAPTHVHLTGVISESGDLCYATVLDITERRRAEESLLQSEQRLKDVIFSLADWLWEVDENGIYTFSSQKGFDLFGDSEKDVIGKSPFDFMPPEEAVRVTALFTEIANRKAPIKDLENWNINKKGERICLLTNGVPILDSNGNLKGYRGVDKDITESKQVEEALKESEHLYRSLFGNMINGFAYCQMHFDENDRPIDFTYLAVNKAFGVLTGLKDVVGKKVTRVIPGIYGTDPELFEMYGRVSKTGKPERFEFFISSLQNWFLLSVYSPEKNFFVTVFDVITEQKNAAAEIQKNNETREQLLRHINEIRENERAVISREIHDQLGQSMTALKLDMNWLQANASINFEIKEKLSNMVALITETISDVQRISSELRPGILDDLGLAAAFEWYAEEFEKRTNLEVIMNLDEIQTKSDQKNLTLFRILQEALTNVIRHAQAKTVIINLHETEQHIILEIIDDGIGIPAGKIKSNRSLGLMGMQDRVNQANGTLEISGGDVSGTVIRISIPVEDA